jgi:hypothetical protein
MKREEKLSLDEFVTAPRKPAPNRLTPDADKPRLSAPVTRSETPSGSQEHVAETNDGDVAPRIEARKALRRIKRERVKGVQNFVNVHLDRETKKRLKLASFTSEISMQSMMEKAIIGYLDENGF